MSSVASRDLSVGVIKRKTYESVLLMMINHYKLVVLIPKNSLFDNLLYVRQKTTTSRDYKKVQDIVYACYIDSLSVLSFPRLTSPSAMMNNTLRERTV